MNKQTKEMILKIQKEEIEKVINAPYNSFGYVPRELEKYLNSIPEINIKEETKWLIRQAFKELQRDVAEMPLYSVEIIDWLDSGEGGE